MSNQPPWAQASQNQTSSGKSNRSQGQPYNNQGQNPSIDPHQLHDRYKNEQKVFQETFGEILPGIVVRRKLYNQLALYFALILIGAVLMAIVAHYFHLTF